MKFCLNLDYNGSNSYFYVSDLKIYRLEAEDSGMKPDPLCFFNVTKKVLQSRAWKNWFARDVYVYGFFTGYYAIDVSDIVDIYKISNEKI